MTAACQKKVGEVTPPGDYYGADRPRESRARHAAAAAAAAIEVEEVDPSFPGEGGGRGQRRPDDERLRRRGNVSVIANKGKALFLFRYLY